MKTSQTLIKRTTLLPLMLLLALPTVVRAQFTFTTNNGTLTLTAYTGPGGDVSIPGTNNGLLVTDIGIDAFHNFTSPTLTSVTIPDSVTNIANQAFYTCAQMTNVTLGGGIISIGSYAFASCSELTNVVIPDSVTSIGTNAFSYCIGLTGISVDALNPVYSSADGVVFDKNQTTLILYPAGKTGSYAIPNSVTNLGNYAFYDCLGLTNVMIPNNVTRIGDFAFDSCTGLTGVTVPDSVTNLGDSVFGSCTTLTNVTLGGGIISIGSNAFEACFGLTNIMIGSNVTSIGSNAFSSCARLTGISVDPLNPVFSSADGVWFNKNQTTLIECPGGRVGGYAIPDSVIDIADQGFYFCTSLTSVTIPNSVTSIGNSAFLVCFNMTSVTIPNSVLSIGPNAFTSCIRLPNVTIPDSVTNIGDGAFADCTSMTGISVDALNPAYGSVDGVLFDKNQTTLIQYPAGKVGNYSIPNTVTNIEDWAFYQCFSLTGVTIPDSVTSIGSFAFDSCTNLTGVTIPDSVTSIGSYAFSFCPGLTGVYFQRNAPIADATVFDDDNHVTVYYLPGTSGWSPTFGGLPTALWNPQAQNLGVQSNQFGFNITGASNLVIVVEASPSLANPVWSPVATNTLTGGSSYFTDPQSSNYPGRFYRFRSP